MPKGKHCETWFERADTLRATFSTMLLILWLLAFTIWLPSAFASDDYPEGDYLHHLWHMEEEDERWNKFMDSGLHPHRNEPQYHAIAYSKSTYKWGYAFAKDTLGMAEREAKSRCGQPDAKVLCWAEGSWYCALADGPNSYGAASGSTQEIAQAKAMAIANSKGAGSKIVLVMGGDPPSIRLYKKKDTPTSQQNAQPNWWGILPSPRH